MSHFPAIEGLVPNQERLIRRMMALSVVAHLAVFLLGSAISPLFPPRQASPPVFVELTDAPPMQELPEETPAAPSKVSKAAPSMSAEAIPRATVPARPAAKENPAARRWLAKLDAGIRKFPDSPVVRKEGKAGGIPVRNWSNEGPAKPGDFAPAVTSERDAALGKQVVELEERVRLSGRPAVGSGSETEASMMFGGVGTSANEQIPPWLRDMIRKKVRGYLPELEAAYSAAIRRNPALKGKLIVRFRIDPSGKVSRAVPVESSFEDGDFIAVMLNKIRNWTFDTPAGQTVEVLYPFVFLAPS
jgi:outer membrane biosynthesis protein TonB